MADATPSPQLGDKLPRLDPQHLYVGKVVPFQAPAGFEASLVVVVNGDKIDSGGIGRRFHDEVANAAADFQCQWTVVAEYRLPIRDAGKSVGGNIMGRIYVNH